MDSGIIECNGAEDKYHIEGEQSHRFHCLIETIDVMDGSPVVVCDL